MAKDGYDFKSGNGSKGITLDGAPIHDGGFDGMMAVAMVHMLNQQRELRAEVQRLHERLDARENERRESGRVFRGG